MGGMLSKFPKLPRSPSARDEGIQRAVSELVFLGELTPDPDNLRQVEFALRAYEVAPDIGVPNGRK